MTTQVREDKSKIIGGTLTIAITDSIFNALEWEKRFSIKERQELNDVVDKIVDEALSQARNEGAKEAIEMVAREVEKEGWSYQGTYDAYIKCWDSLKSHDLLEQGEDKV